MIITISYLIYLILRVFFTFLYTSLIGLPLLIFILPENEKSISLHVVGSVSTSAFIVYISGFTFAYLFSFNIYSVIFTLAIVMLPFVSKKTRRKINSIRISLLSYYQKKIPDYTTLLMAGLLFGTIVLIFSIAVRTEPILNDPYAVWLFLGKEIFLTKHIPLFYGRYADISWSGNYPPLSAFYSALMFLSLGETNPRDFTLIPFSFGLFTVFAVFMAIKTLGGKTSAALFGSSVLIFSSIFTYEMMGWGYVDILGSCFMSIFILFSFLAHRASNFLPYLVVASFSLCDLLVDKYTALIYFPFLLIFIFVLEPRIRVIFKHPARNVGSIIFLASPILVAFTWYARNLILVGDPVYPFLNSIFPAKAILPSYFQGIGWHKVYLLDFFKDSTFIALTNSGNEYPFLVFGGFGLFYFLASKRSSETKILAGLTLSLFTALLVYSSFNLSYVRYFIDLVPLFAVIAGILFLVTMQDVHESNSSKQLKATGTKDLRRFVPLLSKQIEALIMIFILIFLSFSTLTAVSENALNPPQYTVPSAYNVLNSLPNGTVLTNSIMRFFIDKPVVAAYDVPQLFVSPNITYILSVLGSLNVRYIFFAPNFTPFPSYLSNALNQSGTQNNSLCLLNSDLISKGFSIWVVNYN